MNTLSACTTNNIGKKAEAKRFRCLDWYLTTRWVNQYSETLMGVDFGKNLGIYSSTTTKG